MLTGTTGTTHTFCGRPYRVYPIEQGVHLAVAHSPVVIGKFGG